MSITRERLLEIIVTGPEASGAEQNELARMALATMDSEPVAWLLSGGGAKNVVCFDSGNAYADPLREVTPLYRHAQPAPVSYSDFEEFWSAYIHPLAQDDELKDFAWDIWCAAMLNHPEQHLDMVDHSGDVNEKGGAGNSPVIPDGWTCNDKANAALMMLDRIETADPVDDDRIDGIKRIVRELVAAKQPQNAPQNIPEIIPGWIPVSEQKPDCWCLTCRPVTLNDMRFVVCPDCGNKRCPRANDHRNACTGSNEPGQEGSAYPAAPQEVRGA
ncbi:hypothetical protein M8363_06505 [Klebsiella quasivariicola]|uniref:hypothetical protein n=1 Tax=Klebsiella quasivariicola TaxID=2026240 RepID=UPI00202162F5|nr:hypothetical protein [Klebsiella quasivariicola]MCL7686194.1 hypothetical protein [Klebsiella quasivariicola]